jgi:hypothetical protein
MNMASRFETMEVYHEGGVIHAAIEGVPEGAEEFGMYLADVVRAVVREYHQSFDTKRSDGNVFGGICDGFIQAVTVYG